MNSLQAISYYLKTHEYKYLSSAYQQNLALYLIITQKKLKSWTSKYFIWNFWRWNKRIKQIAMNLSAEQGPPSKFNILGKFNITMGKFNMALGKRQTTTNTKRKDIYNQTKRAKASGDN